MTRLDPASVDLINYVDPDPTGTRMVFMPDMLSAGGISTERLTQALANLTQVLDEDVLSGSEMKGALNRASNRTWGMEYERRFTPRAFLEELKSAIEICLRSQGGVR